MSDPNRTELHRLIRIISAHAQNIIALERELQDVSTRKQALKGQRAELGALTAQQAMLSNQIRIQKAAKREFYQEWCRLAVMGMGGGG
jgi:hypothetical protein